MTSADEPLDAQPGDHRAGAGESGARESLTGRLDDDRAQMSALALAQALREGDIDVREHTDAVLAAARGDGARVGAFAHILEELSHRQAEAAQESIREARRRHDLDSLAVGQPLLGVPLPVKDLSRIAGEPWSAGSAAVHGTIAEVTDGVAEKILAGGTVTIGKTSVPEFGMPCYTEPAIGAPARTPWDLERTAGGSSGGAAAAVAAGIVPLAHGSDGGGSVRIPAACCGIVGMKPSRGVVSAGPHGAEGPGLVTDGMLARTVADVAAGMDLIAGSRPGDAFPAASPEGGFLRSLERAPGPLRIGVLREPLNIEAEVHPACLRGLDRALDVLRAHGHELSDVRPAFTPQQWQAFIPLWTVGAASIDLPDEAEPLLLELTRWLRAEGRRHDGVAVTRALAGMQQVARRMGEAYADFDLIITPSLAQPPAHPHTLQLPDGADDFAAQCRFTPWTSTWNMTGRAAISVPLHREEIDGQMLPFGAHLGAVRAGDDALVLQVAAQLEAADPWPLVRRPQP